MYLHSQELDKGSDKRMQMESNRRRHGRKYGFQWIILCAVFLAFVMCGCCGKDVLQDRKEMRERQMLVDHMEEKYNVPFRINAYRKVVCSEPEYKYWPIECDMEQDNFSIRFRRDDLEQFIHDLAEPILGDCKVYITDGMSSPLQADSDTEAFFTYPGGLVRCWIFTPYTEDHNAKRLMLAETLEEHGYDLTELQIVYADQEIYEQVDRYDANPVTGPRDYRVLYW